MSESCGTCRFRLDNPQLTSRLLCRRYPPIKTGTVYEYEKWPEVRARDWCGEYWPKDQPLPPPEARPRQPRRRSVEL